MKFRAYSFCSLLFWYICVSGMAAWHSSEHIFTQAAMYSEQHNGSLAHEHDAGVAEEQLAHALEALCEACLLFSQVSAGGTFAQVIVDPAHPSWERLNGKNGLYGAGVAFYRPRAPPSTA